MKHLFQHFSKMKTYTRSSKTILLFDWVTPRQCTTRPAAWNY